MNSYNINIHILIVLVSFKFYILRKLIIEPPQVLIDNFTFQSKVYDEIYDVFGDGDQTITTEDTTKLVYLEQVLKETLRLFPVLPVVFRELQDDIKISE